ncbi:DNA primase [Candidatus Gottesmanbacteria bacterium]|nr:DNA primase [Candidatus Gottesmanbacteria bacterium]
MDQLEEIKSKIDIVSFISEYLPLKKTGRNFKVLCPFHSEKTPSFIVSAERQIWHCFGGCSDGGDIFKFLMKMENLEFPEALQVLAKRAGVKLVTSYQASEQAKLKEKILKINHLASEFYHYLLTNHRSGKSCLDYVLGRGIKKQLIETFKLGWAPNLWDSLIKFLSKKGYAFSDLETAGLITHNPQPLGASPRGEPTTHPSNYYDRFRGRLIFTLCDHRGNVIGFAGRTLDPKATEAKYINTPETPVYVKGNVLYGLDVTREAIKKQNSAIIVEGEFDLISSFQAGVSNVVAIKGSALTEGQVGLLKRFTQNINLALDTDLAGDEAARRGIEIADRAGFSIKVVKLAQGKDPDECIKINPNLWQKAVKAAIPVFDYFLDSALGRFDRQTAEGKRKIADETIPVLAKITNPIVQAHYLQRLARLLEVSEEVISRAARTLAKKEEIGPSLPAAIPSERSASGRTREQLLEEQLLALVLQSEEPRTVGEVGEFLSVPSVKKIFKLLREYLASTTKKFRIGEFVKTLPAELVPTVDRAYLADLGKTLQDKKLFERELEKTVNEIKKISLKKQLLSLAEKMKQAKKSQLVQLTQEYRQTAAELKKCQTSEWSVV